MRPDPHFTIAEMGLIDFWDALNDELWLLNQHRASEREALMFTAYDFPPERCAELLVIYRVIATGIGRLIEGRA